MFFQKNKFHDDDVRLKNYLVLCAKWRRGLNHSGGNAEGESFQIELQVRGKSAGGGGEGYSEFQVMWMIEWWQKSKPKKTPRLPTKPKKFLD